MPAEHLKPGGASHHLLEQLYRCHILSERAERQWGACSVDPAPAAGHYKGLLLVGIPFMVREPHCPPDCAQAEACCFHLRQSLRPCGMSSQQS